MADRKAVIARLIQEKERKLQLAKTSGSAYKPSGKKTIARLAEDIVTLQECSAFFDGGETRQLDC